MIKDFKEFDGRDIILNGTVKINNCIVKTNYYITKEKDQTKQDEFCVLFGNDVCKYGRPDIDVLIEEARKSEGSDCIGIIGCGPGPMIDEICKKAAFNRIHCHTEIFNF